MYCFWLIADYSISVQIEKWVHSVFKQYLKIYSSFCVKTLLTYVETFALNTDIGNIRVNWVELDLCGIKKVGCLFYFGTPCITAFFLRRIKVMKVLTGNNYTVETDMNSKQTTSTVHFLIEQIRRQRLARIPNE